MNESAIFILQKDILHSTACRLRS